MGETTFTLSYGADTLVPVEVGMPTFRVKNFDPNGNDEALCCNLDLLPEVRCQANGRITMFKQRAAQYYNATIKGRAFKVGDLILRRADVSVVH